MRPEFSKEWDGAKRSQMNEETQGVGAKGEGHDYKA